MGSDRPKQYLELCEKPLLIHTLKALDQYFNQPKFIIAMDLSWEEYVLSYLIQEGLKDRCCIVSGGKERYDSVKNALERVDTTWVGVHDAVRPFVSMNTINHLMAGIVQYPAIIPVLPLKDSLRRLHPNHSEAMNREEFACVQTPQCFHVNVLKHAYALPLEETFTDDASLVEHSGVKIHCVSGNEENIKITSPIDLLLAEQLLTLQ
jgi:2-C-methyl-D-erythritol 4-phosphate cytidylyltransferase